MTNLDRTASALLLALLAAPGCAQETVATAGDPRIEPARDPRIELTVDASEAEAVLAILDLRARGEAVDEASWQRVFDSEPYRRLVEREASLGRAFTEHDFRRFVLSDSLLARAPDLAHTLAEWTTRDLAASARRVLAYLPAEARIRATVYPVIKPQTNSFVFDVRGDPAIFLHLDPGQSAARFENTVAHELHHIGFASVPQRQPDVELPEATRTALEWMGAFGEGFAMLAAAGDVETHPHETSSPGERARWDADVAAFDTHLAELERFFLDVIEGRLVDEAEIRERAFTFFGVQGPWYTVGYRMAVVIERRYGRDELIACMSDPARLLARYNAAAAEAGGSELAGASPATWSPRLVASIGGG